MYAWMCILHEITSNAEFCCWWTKTLFKNSVDEWNKRGGGGGGGGGNNLQLILLCLMDKLKWLN